MVKDVIFLFYLSILPKMKHLLENNVGHKLQFRQNFSNFLIATYVRSGLN